MDFKSHHRLHGGVKIYLCLPLTVIFKLPSTDGESVALAEQT